MVAPKFDGYVVKVKDVTTGTHVKEGDVLATVFGQAILDQAARLLLEQNSAWSRDDELSSTLRLKRPRLGLVFFIQKDSFRRPV